MAGAQIERAAGVVPVAALRTYDVVASALGVRRRHDDERRPPGAGGSAGRCAQTGEGVGGARR